MARTLSCHYDERQNQALLSDPRATLDRIEARCSNPVCLEQVVNGERIMSNFLSAEQSVFFDRLRLYIAIAPRVRRAADNAVTAK